MMTGTGRKKYDLIVIGAGMAGMAAALFAANRGLATARVGSLREIAFASGLFDLLGIHPLGTRKGVEDPWAAIAALVKENPQHPYSRVKPEDINAAFEALFSFLKENGLPYARSPKCNIQIPTPMGTLKTTYAVPQTMWAGVEALTQKQGTLLIDIAGLKGFSAGLIAGTLKESWPGLKTARITFPGTRPFEELYPEHMAQALIVAKKRERLAGRIRPHLNGAQCVGLPAILGLYRSQEVTADMTRLIGVPVFELPTLPPSVPGLRLQEAFERGLRHKGCQAFPQSRALRVEPLEEGFEVEIESAERQETISAQGIILASGRFIGGGLAADRSRVHETLLNLPVFQPPKRSDWHSQNFFDRQGHPISRAGLETDENFRPLDKNGHPAFNTLFAAGSILAHQDWKRSKCGTGLAVATAHGAVESFVRLRTFTRNIHA